MNSIALKKRIVCIFALFLCWNIASVWSQGEPPKNILYVGTFSERGSEGIYVFEFDRNRVKLELIQTVSRKESPTFLAVHPDKNCLYAVYREGMTSDTKEGTVTAFKIDPDGRLRAINEQSSNGASPCHISIDPFGKYAYVSNYGDGSLAVYPIHEDGSLRKASDVIVHAGSGPNSARQAGPHMHSIVPAANGDYVYASDLGTDDVIAYAIDRAKGTLSTTAEQSTQADPGAGPRHFDLHPSGKYAYSLEELSSTITAYSVDQSNGSLRHLERKSLLPADFDGKNTAADIQVSRDGKFLYASNRGHNSLAVFSIDPKTGALQLRYHTDTRGERPRNFLIDQQNEFVFVANRASDNVAVFRRDPDSGALAYTGEQVAVPAAVCIQQFQLK